MLKNHEKCTRAPLKTQKVDAKWDLCLLAIIQLFDALEFQHQLSLEASTKHALAIEK